MPVLRRLFAICALLALSAAFATPARAVVGGTLASPPSWLGAIGSPVFFVRPAGQFCGGTLVKPDKLLTAAHCVSFVRAIPGALRVTFGRADLSDKGGESVGVKSIWVAPGYHETTFKTEQVEHHDIAVLTLTRKLSRKTLPLYHGPYEGRARVYGWGTTSEQDLFNTRLRTADIPTVPDHACAHAYGTSYDPPDMTCAGSPQADTCQFDSGGPLILKGRLAALTSWAYGCARPGYPGVYTRLSNVPLPL